MRRKQRMTQLNKVTRKCLRNRLADTSPEHPEIFWKTMKYITVTETQSLWEGRFSQVARVCVLMGSPGAVHVLDKFWNTAHSPMKMTFNLSENSQLTTLKHLMLILMLLLHQENCLRDPSSHLPSRAQHFPPLTKSLLTLSLSHWSLILLASQCSFHCHWQAHCPLIAMSRFLPSPTKEFRLTSGNAGSDFPRTVSPSSSVWIYVICLLD